MKDPFSVPFIVHGYCFYLQLFTSCCFSFFYHSTFLRIKYSQHGQNTDPTHSKEQEICLAHTIRHIDLHQAKGSDKAYQNCQQPVMLPARVLIQKDILP